jgi:hypothetical protein
MNKLVAHNETEITHLADLVEKLKKVNRTAYGNNSNLDATIAELRHKYD